MKKRSITILYNSPVILTFALLSLLALGLGKLTDGWTTQNLFCVYRSPLTDWLTYPRFFLHVLGHPDFAAYCSNIVMLLVVGPTAEERFGGKRILLAIALTALVTGLVLWFFFPNSALMGASGVVFMLIVLASFAGSAPARSRSRSSSCSSSTSAARSFRPSPARPASPSSRTSQAACSA